MRISIVLGPFFPVPTVLGGAVEKVQIALAKQYAALGHRVTVLSRRYRDFPETEMVDGVRHVRIASHDRTPWMPINLAHDFGYALRASRAATLLASAKPRFEDWASTRTPGCCSASQRAVPSVEALSTTSTS